ncbi:MAG: diacylglycerol kinase [Elusimicrobiota bacterium]
MRKQSLWHSINNALEGIIYAFRRERNLRWHFAGAFAVVVGSLFLKLERMEIALLTFSICLVLITETINTALEVVVNLITETTHPLAKIAKDVSAGAVLLASVNALVVGYLIFIQERHLGENGVRPILQRLEQLPIYVTLIALTTIFLAVIVCKSLLGEDHPLSGGMPSGHSALAFGVSVSVLFVTKNFLLFFLTFILAVIVAESRVRTAVHSWWEVIVGGVLGILVTLLIFQMF